MAVKQEISTNKTYNKLLILSNTSWSHKENRVLHARNTLWHLVIDGSHWNFKRLSWTYPSLYLTTPIKLSRDKLAMMAICTAIGWEP